MKSKIKWGFLTFVVPILIVLLAFAHKKASLHSIFVSDLGEQYYHLFDWYKDVLSGKETLIYSFSKGLGGDMLQTYFYYLSSPFNLLLIFISKSNIDVFIFSLILTKLGLCGVSVFIYLNNKKNNLELYQIFLLSISYSLMSYNLTYFFNIMWLDIVIISPMVLLGIDYIFENKSGFIYTFCLFFAIFLNYYLAYMLCCFSVIYCIYKCVVLKNKINIKKNLKKFFLCSLIAGLLSAFVLIPVLFGIHNIFRIKALNDNSVSNMFVKFMKLIYNCGVRTQYIAYDYSFPYIHSTFMVAILVISTLTNNKKSVKPFLLICFIFFVFLIINDDILYFFSTPVLFHYRYTFLFVLFLIIYISDFYVQKTVSNKLIFIITVIYFSLNLISTFFLKKAFSFYLIFVNLYLLICTFFANNIYIRKKNKKSVFVLLQIFLVIIELYIACNATMRYLSKEEINEFKKEKMRKENISSIKSDYYRINSRMCFSTGKSTSAMFLSTNNSNIFEFLEKTGSGISSAWYDFYSNKFLVSVFGYQYNEKCDVEQNCLITPNYSTSIGYMINEGKQSNKNPKDISEYNNEFAKFLYSDIGKIYIKSSYKKINDNTYIIDSNKKNVYVDIDYNDNYYSKIYLNDKLVFKNYINEQNVLDLKLKSGNNILKIKGEKNLKSKISTYYIDDNELNKLIDYLNEESLKINKINKNELVGSINVSGNKKTLLITIPYQKGWTIYVDGKKVKYKEMFGTFIGIDLKAGNHSIEMKYYDHNILIGKIISIFTAIILLIIIFCKKNIYFKKNNENIKKI